MSENQTKIFTIENDIFHVREESSGGTCDGCATTPITKLCKEIRHAAKRAGVANCLSEKVVYTNVWSPTMKDASNGSKAVADEIQAPPPLATFDKALCGDCKLHETGGLITTIDEPPSTPTERHQYGIRG